MYEKSRSIWQEPDAPAFYAVWRGKGRGQSASSSRASTRKLTGRNPSLQESMADLGIFHPAVVEALSAVAQGQHKGGEGVPRRSDRSPAGFSQPLARNTCPSSMSQAWAMGFSYWFDQVVIPGDPHDSDPAFFHISIPSQWSISCWMIWAVQPVKVLMRVLELFILPVHLDGLPPPGPDGCRYRERQPSSVS